MSPEKAKKRIEEYEEDIIALAVEIKRLKASGTPASGYEALVKKRLQRRRQIMHLGGPDQAWRLRPIPTYEELDQRDNQGDGT